MEERTEEVLRGITGSLVYNMKRRGVQSEEEAT